MRILILAVLLGLSGVLYAPALYGEFIMDDWGYISENKWLTEAPSPLRFWTTLAQVDYWPVSYSVFWVLWKLAGSTTWPYHLLNLVIHGCNAFLLYLLVASRGRIAALLAAILFLVHPLQVQAVAWIFQLKTLLAAFGVAIACLAYQRRAAWAAILSYALSLFAKTSGVMLPLVLAGHELVLERRQSRWRTRYRVIGAMAVIAALSGSLTLWVNANQPESFAKPVLPNPDWPLRFVQAGKNLAYYAGQAFWPRAMPLLQLQDPLVGTFDWMVAATLVALFGGALFKSLRAASLGRTGAAELAGGLGFYLANLVPALGFVVIPAMSLAPVANHWSYLANAGLATAVACLVTMALNHRPYPFKIVAWTGMTLLVVLLINRSRHQAESFTTEIRAWQDVVEVAPASAVAHYNLGTAYNKRGLNAQAVREFERTVVLDPTHKRALYNIGVYQLGEKQFEASVESFRRALAIDRKFGYAYHNLAVALENLQKPSEALAVLREGLAALPDDALLRSHLCQLAAIFTLTASEQARCGTPAGMPANAP